MSDNQTAPLDAGLYRETVMSTRRNLLVPNALQNPGWNHNPDLRLGMIAHCGQPLTWPDGESFGYATLLPRWTLEKSRLL